MLNFSDINTGAKVKFRCLASDASVHQEWRSAMRFRRSNHKLGFVAVSPAMHFRLIFLLFLYLVERTNLRLSPNERNLSVIQRVTDAGARVFYGHSIRSSAIWRIRVEPPKR
jgi:hypothetical protein